MEITQKFLEKFLQVKSFFDHPVYKYLKTFKSTHEKNVENITYLIVNCTKVIMSCT